MARTSKRALSLAVGAALVAALGVTTSGMAADEMAASETSVSIPSTDYDIVGTMAMPASAEGPVPAVLMLHGYGSSADEVGDMYGRLADALAAQGIASLRIDFAGMGASEASTLEYTYDSEVSDAATAMDWLAAQEGIDPERLGVQGFSLGSTIAAHLAGTDGRVAAFGSWSGAIYDGDQFFYGPDVLAECEAEGHLDMDLGWRTLDHSCGFFSSHLASTALTDFSSFTEPALLVYGTEDEDVDPAVSQHAAEVVASEDVTLEAIEGADHIYLVLGEDQTLADQVINLTADWYAEKL